MFCTSSLVKPMIFCIGEVQVAHSWVVVVFAIPIFSLAIVKSFNTRLPPASLEFVSRLPHHVRIPRTMETEAYTHLRTLRKKRCVLFGFRIATKSLFVLRFLLYSSWNILEIAISDFRSLWWEPEMRQLSECSRMALGLMDDCGTRSMELPLRATIKCNRCHPFCLRAPIRLMVFI